MPNKPLNILEHGSHFKYMIWNMSWLEICIDGVNCSAKRCRKTHPQYFKDHKICTSYLVNSVKESHLACKDKTECRYGLNHIDWFSLQEEMHKIDDEHCSYDYKNKKFHFYPDRFDRFCDWFETKEYYKKKAEKKAKRIAALNAKKTTASARPKKKVEETKVQKNVESLPDLKFPADTKEVSAPVPAPVIQTVAQAPVTDHETEKIVNTDLEKLQTIMKRFAKQTQNLETTIQLLKAQYDKLTIDALNIRMDNIEKTTVNRP